MRARAELELQAWAWAAEVLAPLAGKGPDTPGGASAAWGVARPAAGLDCPPLQEGRVLAVHACLACGNDVPTTVVLVNPDKLCLVHLRSGEPRRGLHSLLTARARGRPTP